MPNYIYRAKRSPTVIVDGEISAGSRDEAVHKLSEMGLSPLHIEPSGGGLVGQMAALPERTGGEVTRREAARGQVAKSRDIDQFTRQLSTLVRSNVPILQALALIAQQPSRNGFAEVIQSLASLIRQGNTLSDAMSRYPLIFDNLYISLVIAGERGGVLDHTLARLAEHREREQEIRRNIQAALAYPAFLAVAGALTVFGVLTFFLPRVIGLFETLRQELPWPTVVLIAVTKFTSGNWPWFVIGGVLLAAIFFRNRPGSRKKMIIDLLKLHTPLVRHLVKNAEIAKFSRTMGMLTRNGISIHESLNLSINTLDNDALRGKIEQVGSDIVNKGVTLSESLGRTRVFPIFALNMIRVGEESGQLPETLEEIALAYDREVNAAVKVMMSLLEPLLILIMGAVVAFIVFAMLMPIFDIGGF